MFFPREGCKKPNRLAWIPEDVKVKFEERSERSAAWMVLLLGATLVFASEVESALPQWGVFVGPVCLVAALWVGDLFTKSISRPAEERFIEAIKVKIQNYDAQRKEEMESEKFAARIKRGAVRILRPVTSAFSLFRRFVREGSAKQCASKFVATCSSGSHARPASGWPLRLCARPGDRQLLMTKVARGAALLSSRSLWCWFEGGTFRSWLITA